jgi:hypothetical protein
VRILGDDHYGAHSTATIVGSKAVIGCAHSLNTISDPSARTRTSPQVYVEDYWIQSVVTRSKSGDETSDGRIKIALFKFNVENDWAVFQRVDGLLFNDTEIAHIDLNPPIRLFQESAVFHMPVGLLPAVRNPSEFSIGCNFSGVHIQSISSHHIKYEGRDLVRGSSGGAVFIKPSKFLVGMHTESFNENEFNEEDVTLNIVKNSKRSGSEEAPYGAGTTSKTQIFSDSETIASASRGTNGLGSAIIICKFNRLMHYINECEK